MPEQGFKTEYVVVARASRPGPMPFVLKDGESFGVFDPHSDILSEASDDFGVFHRGMRHISRLELRLWGARPLLLSSTVREDNCVLVAHLMNPDLEEPGREWEGSLLPKGVVYVQRTSVLTPDSCLQQLAITNFSESEITVPITVLFQADFHDIFEVRGMRRDRRGELRRDASDDMVRLRYAGLDGEGRVSELRLGSPIEKCDSYGVGFCVRLRPNETRREHLAISFRPTDGRHSPLERFEGAVARTMERFRTARRAAARIHTSNEQFNQWINRSFSDIHLLATETESGLYPYAGVPWFSAPFGRDGILTAHQLLTVEPDLARGVLAYLAARQATEEDPERDAEPGKILHESRLGEMAALGEIPFGRYYGSIDSTPLFLILAHEYFRRTHDLDFIRSIWPHIEAALAWMREYGDGDGDGFIEYQRRTEAGLRNQGWKDSADSISHHDGRLADGPIALCEVQAYAYGALRGVGELCRALGRGDEAERCAREASALRERFAANFWREDLGTYALALDGDHRPCDVRSSNAGHALWTGIASDQHAAGVARTLMSSASFGGWGVRTLAAGEVRYNPMSYHNGSVWPHDNAIIAMGLSRYGCKAEALQILTGLFEASSFMPMHRLPELFCGFPRGEDEGPTLYPVACVPQAWASGAVFALLEAVLGISISMNPDSGRPSVRLTSPSLPPYLRHVNITNLRVGEEEIDLALHRYQTDVGVNTTRRSPRVEIVVTK